MGMTQTIIDNAMTMESEVIRADEDSQKAYEDSVKDSNASIQEKTKSPLNISEEKSPVLTG